MDWGLPDWQDKASYGDVSQWTEARWRWEFTRRWDEYRKQAIDFLDRMETGFEGDDQYQAWIAYWERWGYSLVLDPRRSDYPPSELTIWPKQGLKSSANAALRPGEGEIALILQPNQSEARQLEFVKRELKRLRTKARDKLHQPDDGGQLWLSYLRFLDALEAKAAGSLAGTSDQAIYDAVRVNENSTPAAKAKKRARSIVTQWW